MKKSKLGFIGVGQMAGAILKGAVKSGIVGYADVALYDINPSKLDVYKQEGAIVFESIQELAENVNILVLSVKPQNFNEVAPQIKSGIESDTVIVSILAGISGKQIKTEIGESCKVVLAMPNTPLLLAQGATGLARMENVSDSEFEEVKAMFGAVGVVEEVPPELINSVIPISGSTPAFIYRFADEIVNYAESSGISRDKAMNLFAQTLIGSAHMLTKTGLSPRELVKMVSSPGGTTIEGLKALDEHGFNKAVFSACEACMERAEQLSKLANHPDIDIMVKKIPYDGTEYKKVLELREKILREPLGLKLSEKDVEDDYRAIHFVAMDGEEIVGTGQYLELDAFVAQIKQMVVDTTLQKKGVGKLLMQTMKKEIQDKGFKKITLNAREYAIGFYEMLGYKTRGSRYFINGVPHFTMYQDI